MLPPAAGGGEWSSGLLDCCHGGSGEAWLVCAVGEACPCVVWGQNLRDAGLVDDCCGPCCLQCLCVYAGATLSGGPLAPAAWAATAALGVVPVVERACFRRALVRATGRDEAVWQTALIELCCWGCSLTQIHRDLAAREYAFAPERRGPGACCGCPGDAPLGVRARRGREGLRPAAPMLHRQAVYYAPLVSPTSVNSAPL